MPRFVCNAKYDASEKAVTVTVINNTGMNITGHAILWMLDKPILSKCISISEKSIGHLKFHLTDSHISFL
jgi:hypothetical protein